MSDLEPGVKAEADPLNQPVNGCYGNCPLISHFYVECVAFAHFFLGGVGGGGAILAWLLRV